MKRVIAIISIIALMCVARYLWLGRSPNVPPSAHSAQIILLASDFATRQADVRVSDPSVLAHLIDLLVEAEPTGDHKCTSAGAIIFDGEESFAIGLLPGHDPNFYEFRFDERTFRIPRKDFIKVLESAGIERADLRLSCGAE